MQAPINVAKNKKRLQNQKNQILGDPADNWKITSCQKQNEWEIQIIADSNCPFNSTPFKLTVRFTEKYPYEVPQFILQEYAKFYHPNIHPTSGRICQTTITNNDPTITLRKRIDAFIFLLAVPNPESPLNHEAAALCKSQPRKYYRKATQKFKGTA